jgi:excisionase family DNA binding protein
MSRDRHPPLPKLHLIDDVAELLGLSSRTVRRLIARGELLACHLGRSVRVHPDDLADYIDRHRGRCPRLTSRGHSSHYDE